MADDDANTDAFLESAAGDFFERHMLGSGMPALPPVAAVEEKPAESLATLQGMCGCSERVAHWALWECKGDVERASNWILSSETMRSEYDVRPLPEEARVRQTLDRPARPGCQCAYLPYRLTFLARAHRTM